MFFIKPKAPKPLYLSDEPGGPDPGTLLCHLSDLPNHGGFSFEIKQDGFVFRLALQRDPATGVLYLFRDHCPHAGSRLNPFGNLLLDHEEQHLVCRSHGALFTIDTGRCVLAPCKGEYLRQVAFREKDGSIYSL